MARNPRIVQAFRAMKEIGIREDKVKPVLKRLLNLYEKNWELIESENYRVLADAIFDEEESKVSEPEKYKKCDEDEDTEGGGLVHDELVRRPLKRLRRLGETSSSHRTGSPNVAGTLLKKPKVEDEPSPASLQQKSLQCNIGKRTEYLPASPGSVSPQPVSPASVSPHHGDRTALPGPVLFQSPSPAHASPHHGAAKERN
ncbi:hypothetical protein GOBAR_AA37159 [Gossypium barbadense]|uniref:WIYLD domain-containing protein n=1 Tax=Gossypium barbadense TaxID=3634 RepID=A0A2P5VXK4_GOSBA|nr:hypothetical protein GOBAR_AA37159 [Gossypium barbadense]